MTVTTAILGLHAQSSVHAGAGSSMGVIDLPIQRESHNGWPCILGSAVKGSLRARAEVNWGAEDARVTCLFGPDTNNASDHAGALMISDARLLLLPVRSLTSQFRFVTCYSAIKRLAVDRQRFDFSAPSIPEGLANLAENEAIISNGQVNTDRLFLEEYRFETKSLDLTEWINTIAPLLHDETRAKKDLENQLVIVSDDIFAHLAASATPVNAHIAINSETKTVKPGALWYEETLPPETVLYVCVGANASRSSRSDPARKPMTADEVSSTLQSLFSANPWLQLGGNETVGMGWFSVRTEAP